MEQGAEDMRKGQMASSDAPSTEETRTVENTKDSKGKQKADATFVDRMQKSASMILKSMADSKGEPISIPGASKTEQGQQHDSSRLYGDVGEPATLTQSRQGVGQPLRTQPSSDETESSFESFQQQHAPLQSTRREAANQSYEVEWSEATDGHAVLHLLDEPPSEAGVLGVFAPTDTEALITPEEAQRLRDALFKQSQESAPWATLLKPSRDLLPRLDDGHTSYTLTGTSDTESAQQQWLEQWRNVLSSYNEEVWGDLGPLAAEAKVELSREAAATDSTGHQALDRLRLILAHLRG